MSTVLVLQIIALMFTATLCTTTIIAAAKRPYRPRKKVNDGS